MHYTLRSLGLITVLVTSSMSMFHINSVEAAEDAVICPADRINSNGNICTASDVQLAAAAVGAIDRGLTCFAGDQLEVAVAGTVNLRKGDRFDIGVWIATDGKPIELRSGANGTPDEGGASQCEVMPWREDGHKDLMQ